MAPDDINSRGRGHIQPSLGLSEESSSISQSQNTYIEGAAGPEEDTEAGHGLKRSLTLFDGISVLLGVVVGSGIFASPGVVLGDVGSVGLALLTWTAAGCIAYCSSLVYAELGSSIPAAGGDGEYLRIAFGDMMSFVYTWMFFFVSCGGGNSIVVLTFARYAGGLLADLAGFDGVEGLGTNWVKVIAIAAVAILTIVNCRGVELGSAVQNVLSGTKAVLVALIVVAAAAYVARDRKIVLANASRPMEGSSWAKLGPGLIAAIWAFDGWNSIMFMSEEFIDPARDLPRTVAYSMLITCTTYVAMNIAYLCVLPAAVVKSTQVIAVLTVSNALGSTAGKLTSLLVAFNVLGASNSCLMTSARYLYAAARQGNLPSLLAVVSGNGSPVPALILSGLWTSILLALSSNLEQLLNFFGIATWIFYGAVAVALMRLRRAMPGLRRPYSVRPYPAAPLLLVAVSLYILTSSLYANPIPSLLSIGLVVLGFPVYYVVSVMRGRRRRKELDAPLLQ